MADLQQMVSFSLHQMVIFLVVVELLIAIPMGLFLKRVGFSPLWALLSFVPVLGIPALWLLAFIRWPRDAQA